MLKNYVVYIVRIKFKTNAVKYRKGWCIDSNIEIKKKDLLDLDTVKEAKFCIIYQTSDYETVQNVFNDINENNLCHRFKKMLALGGEV
jgi:hypothetical protein